MDTIFTLGDEDEPNIKLNLDELYERKKIRFQPCVLNPDTS